MKTLKFYVIESHDPGGRDVSADYLIAGKYNSSPAPRCESCGGITGLREWIKPYRAEIRIWGSEYPDLIYGFPEFLVSNKFASLWKKEQLSGLGILGRAEITKVTPRKMSSGIPKYSVCRVIQSAAIVDDVKSGIEYEERWTCPVCRIAVNMLKIQRVVIEKGNWKGEDLFVARGLPGTIIASDRFKEFWYKHGFVGIKLINALDYSVDWTVGN